MSKRWSSAAALGLIISIAGCAHPTGPIFGDWRGEQPSRITDFTKTVELVLEGPAGAQSGRYRIATTFHNPDPISGHGTRRWSDIWTSEQRTVGGRPQMIIHLHNTLPGDIDSYALAPDGSLRVLYPSGQVDDTPGGRRYVLSPVRPGPGYGES
jgi:hypothetical protein